MHREDARVGGDLVDDDPLEVLGDFSDLQLDVVYRTLDIGLPRFESGNDLLNPLDPRLASIISVAEAGLPLGVEIIDALLPLVVVLVELVEDHLRVGVHGALETLEPSEVIVGGVRIQGSDGEL